MEKVKGIRSKNLRQFLEIYFYAYIYTTPGNSPLHSDMANQYRAEHPPRIFPGLAAIQRYLKCQRTTAQDYLKAVHITREIFATKTQQLQALHYIRKKKHDRLMIDLSSKFEGISKQISASIPKNEKARVNVEIRKLLEEVVQLISEQKGIFTVDECTRIVREFASWFV